MRTQRYYMMKKLFLAIFSTVYFTVTSIAQTNPPEELFRVRQAMPAGPEITPLLKYQVAQAWKFDLARQQKFAAISNEKELSTVQGELREKLLSMIGGLPESRTPLNAKIVGTIQMDGFQIEKLLFESIPGFHVTANVYVPQNNSSKKFPAILVPCGHSQNGKVHYQALCQRLVKQGYIVICWDPVGQGERSQFWSPQEKRSKYNLVCGEHAVLGNMALLAGASLARWEIWDGMRAIDYLVTRPDVDANRISISGTSGGGFQTAHIAALDERIKVAVPSCYITALPMRAFNRIFEDADSDPEQDINGMVANGIDHAGLLLLMYPRPVMIAAAALDFFPIEGTNKTYNEIADVYRRLGHAERIGFTEGFHKHQYSPQNQLAAINFLNRFNGLPAIDSLPPVTELEEARLLCTGSGQLEVDFSNEKNLIDLIQTYVSEHRSNPISMPSVYYNDKYPHIREWKVNEYNNESAQNEIAWKKIGTSTFKGITIDKYNIHHSDGLNIPTLYLHTNDGVKRKTILWIDLFGKVAANDWSEVSELISKGFNIISFDFRGTGEDRMNYTATSSDELSFGSRGFDEAYHSPVSGVMANYVYNSLLIGRPYFLQMIEDTEIVLKFAQSHLQIQEMQVRAKNNTGLLAQKLVEVFPNLKVESKLNVITWFDIINQKIEKWPIEYIMPGGVNIK
jgi:hypothetical protein